MHTIGSDHRPVFAALNIEHHIPHIGSLCKQTITTDPENIYESPVQPQRKYLQNLDDEEKWDEFTSLAQSEFLSSLVLTTTPTNHHEINTWAETFSELIDSSVEQTIGWHEPSSQPITDVDTTNKEQTYKTMPMNHNIQSQTKETQQYPKFCIKTNSNSTCSNH